MKKYLLLLFFTIVVGSAFGKYLYDKTIDVSAMEKDKVYFLEAMSSKSKEELISDTKDIEPKIILKTGSQYTCYIAISANVDNIKKIKEKYNDGYMLIESSKEIEDVEFLNNLEQFDQLLLNADTKEEIKAINSVILSSYEEMVLNK